MISEKAFVEMLNKWDELFTVDTLTKAYKGLSPLPEKQYIVAIMDGLQPSFVVNQSTGAELKSAISEYIRRYREESVAYIPRILIIDLKTARQYKDPTEWGPFLWTKN